MKYTRKFSTDMMNLICRLPIRLYLRYNLKIQPTKFTGEYGEARLPSSIKKSEGRQKHEDLSKHRSSDCINEAEAGSSINTVVRVM